MFFALGADKCVKNKSRRNLVLKIAAAFANAII